LVWLVVFFHMQHIWYWQTGQHGQTTFQLYLNNLLCRPKSRQSCVTR
jgi:hypothetical protein